MHLVYLFLIIGIVLGALGVNFALQNPELVTVTFFVWQFSAPLASVILGSMLAGIGVTLVALIPSAIRDSLDAFAIRRAASRSQDSSPATQADPTVTA